MPAYHFQNSDQLVAAFAACTGLAVLFLFWYRHYLRMPFSRVWLLALVAVVAGIAWLWATSGHVLDNSP